MTRSSLQPTREPGDYAFAHRLRTRFAETDAMGIVHHGAYLPYLEEARVEYLRAIGHPYDSVRDQGDGGGVEFAVLEASVHYRKALRFDDEVTVHLVVGGVTRTTFQIAYLLTVDGNVRATAVTVHGAVDRDGRPARLPAWVRDEHPGLPAT